MWVHKKSGKTYSVVSMNASVKIDGVWVKAVIYNGISNPMRTTFVRPQDNFLEKFVEVQQESTGVRKAFNI